MKTIRTKKIGTLIILSAYFLMLGVPTIQETCCRHFQHEEKQAGAVKTLSAVENVAHHHVLHLCSRQEGGFALTTQDGTYLDTASGCHHHSLAACYPPSIALPGRNSSTFPAFEAISSTYLPSDNVSMGRENPLSSDGLLGAASTIASLRTTILLI